MVDEKAGILLVEDDRVDVMTVQRALKQSNISNPLHVARTATDALAMLRGQGPSTMAAPPALILLDLNLPRMSGRELLAKIKTHPVLSRIPVVVLTTSQAEEDIVKSYGLHANCYISKPVEFEKFAEVVRVVKDFWFGVVKLPPMPA